MHHPGRQSPFRRLWDTLLPASFIQAGQPGSLVRCLDWWCSKPFSMVGLRVLLPFWAGFFQLLEIVIQREGDIELIHLRVLNCHYVVRFDQVIHRLVELHKLEYVNHSGSTWLRGSIRLSHLAAALWSRLSAPTALDAIGDILDDEVCKIEGLDDSDEYLETDLQEMAWFSLPWYSMYMWHLLYRDFAMCSLQSTAGWATPSDKPMHVLRACPWLRRESQARSIWALAATYCDPMLLTNGVVSHIFAFTPWLRYDVIFGSRAALSQNFQSKTVWGWACWAHRVRRNTSNCIWLSYAMLLRISNLVMVLHWTIALCHDTASVLHHYPIWTSCQGDSPNGLEEQVDVPCPLHRLHFSSIVPFLCHC